MCSVSKSPAKQLILLIMVLLTPLTASANQRGRIFYHASTDRVFQAALKASHENFVVTYIDKKGMTFAFHTSDRFDCKASVAKTLDGVKVLLDVRKGRHGFASEAEYRIADSVLDATGRNLEDRRYVSANSR
jgi:hypothetical protein